MRSTPSRHDDVECTGSFRRCRRRHCRIAVRAHLARLLLLWRGNDFLLPMLDLCMQAHARARRSASSRNSGRRQSFRRPASALRWCIARCCADASAGPSAGMTATASTTTSAGETFRAALGSGGKGGSSTQAERSALVEAVGGSSSSAIRLRRARARAGGIVACMAECDFPYQGISRTRNVLVGRITG